MFIDTMYKRFPLGNSYFGTINFVLDSYSNLLKCMPEPVARRNGMLNGLELLISTHFLNDEEWMGSQLDGDGC